MAKRPNILLITSDQHRGDSYGFENPGIYTPPLDRLARNGTRFPACITPSPICQPARASILTGLLPLTHGVCDNGIDMPADIAEQGFAGQLTRGGYCTAMIGKADFATMHTFAPTGTPECKVRPTIRRTGMALTWAFSTPNWSWRATTTGCPPSPPHGQNYEHWYHGDGLGEEKNALSKEARPPLTDAVQTCNSALPVAWHNSTWVGDQTIRYLDGCADSDEPFCVWASFPSPPLPVRRAGTLVPAARSGDGPASAPPHTRSRAPAVVAQGGSQSPARTGRRQNSWQLPSVPGLLRVGMIVRGPDDPRGKIVDDPVSTVDLVPTFLDWANVASEGPLRGQSLRSLIETDTAHRDFPLCEWDLGPSRVGVPLRLRTKLTVELASGAGELYDLASDPNEMNNRFDDPSFAGIRAELLAMIASRPNDARDTPLPRAGMA